MYFIDQKIMQRLDPMEVNFEGIEMKKWNRPTNRAQRVDEENRVNCLVVMFIPRVIVTKVSKMAHFLYFLLMPAKISHSLDKIFTCFWKILFSSIRKCYGLLDSELPLARYQLSEIQGFVIFCLLSSFLIFLPSISQER